MTFYFFYYIIILGGNMKKVTILSLHLGYGGIEKCVSSLANMLVDNYEVEIATVYKLYEEPSFYIDPRVKIIYLTDVIPNKNDFKDALKNHKIITTIKEGKKSLNILKERKKKTIEYIKSCNSDVIISTRDIFNTWLGKYGKENTLKIGWEHNHPHGNTKYSNNIIKSSKNLDYFVLVSKALKDYYSDSIPKSIYIPNVIDYIPEKSSNLKDKRLVSVGRLSPEKGYDDLLKIFKELNKTYKDWKLDIVGSGNEEENLKNYIKENNLEKSVTLHGFKDTKFIYDLFNKSSIYLMTSHTESFGIVLIEAMSAGLPCIAFKSAEGANEIIKDSYNGYLIDNRSKEEYIEKVKKLMDNYELRKKLGVNARESIDKYSSSIIKEEWISLIEKGD